MNGHPNTTRAYRRCRLNEPVLLDKAPGFTGCQDRGSDGGIIYRGVRRVRTPPNLPPPALTFCVVSQSITRGFVIAARGSMTIDATGTTLGLVQRACTVRGWVRTYLSPFRLLSWPTFLVNSPHVPPFNTYCWREHF